MDVFTSYMFSKYNLLIFLTKSIRDNYRIYSLIMIIIARILVNVRCGLFKM
jgi:hypothetical protein